MKVTEEIKQRVKELRGQGLSCVKISNVTGVSKTHVHMLINPEAYERKKLKEKRDYINNADRKKNRSKLWRQRNTEYLKEYSKIWRKENRARRNSLKSLRRSKMSKMYKLLSKEQKIQINNFYILARALSAATKIPYQVDHIHPIMGKKSCGLHVPHNLQILTKIDNLKKGISNV